MQFGPGTRLEGSIDEIRRWENGIQEPDAIAIRTCNYIFVTLLYSEAFARLQMATVAGP